MIKQYVIDLLQTNIPDIKIIYLFGSRASNDQHALSDWDFAYKREKSSGSLEVWNLKNQLSADLSVDVDLIDLDRVGTTLQFQVISHGRVIWQHNEQHTWYYEALVLSAYQKLNEERKEILEDIAKRGSVYG